MHERTQRAVARLLFVFCCAVPTSFVLLAVTITWTPWYRNHQADALSHELSQETGLAVRVGEYRRIAPGRFVLESIEFANPESEQLVAQIRRIDWIETEGRIGIELHQPTLFSRELGQAWRLLHDRIISRPEHTLRPINVAASDLTIKSLTGSLPLPDASAVVEPTEGGVRMYAEAGNIADPTEGMVRVSLFRDRVSRPATSEITLTTNQTTLPCSALAEYLPWVARLGTDAGFSGTLSCRQQSDGWAIALDGSSLTSVDLSRLSEALPHRITGHANVHFDRCRIEPGRAVNVAARLYSRDGGWIGRSLLQQLSERMGWLVAPATTGGDSVEYSHAAIHLSVTNERLTLSGICRPHQDYEGDLPGVALCAGGLPIAKSGGTDVAADALIAALRPHRRHLPLWNQILLPSPKHDLEEGAFGGQIRRAQKWTGGELIHQK